MGLVKEEISSKTTSFSLQRHFIFIGVTWSLFVLRKPEIRDEKRSTPSHRFLGPTGVPFRSSTLKDPSRW